MTDWEFYWDLASRIESGVGLIITGCLVYYFVRPFLLEKRYAGLIGITYSSVMLIFDFCDPMVDSMFAFAVGVIMAFLVMYLIDRRNGKQKIFLAVTFYLLIWISWGVVILPWILLYQLILMRPSMVDQYALSFGLFIVMELLYLIMEDVMMLLCIRMIHREYHCKRENMTKGELALMLAPSLSLIAGYGSFRFATNAYETDTSRYLWNSHSEWHWILALYMLLAFAAMLTIIISYQRIKDSRRKEKEEAVLAGQAKDMKRHISEVEKLYRDICGIRHDMGNHIATLEHLYNRKEYENAEKYIAQWKASLQETSPEIKTGNPVTDVILTERKKEAEEKGIEFVCDFHYPEGTKVNAFDLSVVLNNALNNAISGAEESDTPYVQISSYRKQNAYMIEVRNPYTGELVLHEETGLPETTKKDKEGHGFGMANIQKVAQKYYGDIAIELEENCFLLHIMLMVG